MIFKSLHQKKFKFQKIKVSTKRWKVKIILPYYPIFNEKDEAGGKSVWEIRQVLN